MPSALFFPGYSLQRHGLIAAKGNATAANITLINRKQGSDQNGGIKEAGSLRSHTDLRILFFKLSLNLQQRGSSGVRVQRKEGAKLGRTERTSI